MIRGFIVNRFDGIGIHITGAGATGNLIEGNFLGTDATGTVDLGNAREGVRITDGSANTIGGTTAAARNIISGNNQAGVFITGATASSNLVLGNYIGTDVTGSLDLGNTDSGVDIRASGNTVGGSMAGARNIISGNDLAGVFISEATSSSNLILGNYIGTDVTGSQALGNAESGVDIRGPGNTVGGTAAGAGNVISGNTKYGVVVFREVATGNTIQGNFIGTNAAGSAAVANNWTGVGLWSANNTVGGTTPGAGNVISGNLNYGINVEEFDGAANGNIVQGNLIGTNAAGTAAIGNAWSGILLKTASNQIGGTTAGAENVIAYNGINGVVVDDSLATQNRIQGNRIYENAGLGIDLGDVGITPNDLDDFDAGSNDLQNFPGLTSALVNTQTINGTLNSTADTAFTIEFFVNPTPAASFGSFDQGQTFLDRTTVVTDGTGNVSFSFSPTAAFTVGQALTATATDNAGNTSEF